MSANGALIGFSRSSYLIRVMRHRARTDSEWPRPEGFVGFLRFLDFQGGRRFRPRAASFFFERCCENGNAVSRNVSQVDRGL